MIYKKGGVPFLFKGGDDGILFVHGFTGSPDQLKPMAYYLNREGYTCLGIRLRGHGTDPQDMANYSDVDWIEDVTEGYRMLRSLCRRVYICGISMGASLGLFIGENYAVDGLLCMSAPVYVYMNRALPLCRILKCLKRYVALRPESYFGKRFSPGYSMIPLCSIDSLYRVMKNVKKGISQVRCPLLLLQSVDDMLVKPESAQFIYDNVSSRNKRLLFFNDGGHNLVAGREKYSVFSHCLEFLKGLH